ncbi:L-aspartate oxidase [Helicobacter enhydrae]|uniref:L-aspartate oxidase n=1 Tax=Helicobacter enhydrae TaxID=222136 RepID=A0A1B1U457_9HELI|nr:FAD-dependent oxidoreductase [Helicobacter enhydrae]ANV97543.1 L-aspartate oxidase [Helicobacter enhydrae]
MEKYDVIIIGSGVAGLYCAIHLPQTLKVLVVCKDEPNVCNTFYAQGGISVALDQNDVQAHIEDTLKAGLAMNCPQALQILSQESLNVTQDLAELGLLVDRDSAGKILYTREGGHQKARIIHFGGDGTGKILHSFLLQKLKHPIRKHTNVLDLLFEANQCVGVVLESGGEVSQVYGKHIVLASGGIGDLYQYHTNAHTLGGEMHGVMLEHHFKLQDMEMTQFHPSVFTQAQGARKPLISEAVRGEGGMIVDRDGLRFLLEYDSRGELAPRDVVSRAIFDYCLKRQMQEVFLDLSAFGEREFQGRFPNIYKVLKSYGFNPPQDRIPIFPAFHYCMGGIKTDLHSRVIGAENLYAIGECSHIGIHGANRLASNSLLEGFVFGKRVAQMIANARDCEHTPKCLTPKNYLLHHENDEAYKRALKRLMWEKVGIARSDDGLAMAFGEIEGMLQKRCGRMVYLRLLCAREIVSRAMERKESLGAHYLLGQKS